MGRYVLEPLGEEALLLRLGKRIDVDCNRAVHALAARLQAQAPPWLRDCVPAYASLALFIDAHAFDGRDPLPAVRDWLARQPDPAALPDEAPRASPIDMPVCYDAEFAPDLAVLAAHAGLSPDEVIARHQAPTYQVAMIGFAPGFPYLLGLDPALAMPRLATPRMQVAAGSVGIGGAQAGIYPRESPGGWRIIGRTPLRLFDPAREQPALLAPGQSLRFVAIGRSRFDALLAS